MIASASAGVELTRSVVVVMGNAEAAAGNGRLVFVAGLSTASATDEYSGRGVGMGAVREELAQAGYEVEIESESGRHTRITLSCKTCALRGAA